MGEKKHSVLPASGAERWIACPGSVALSEGIPRTTSPYATEGTAAHEVAEACLKGGIPASTVAMVKADGREIEVTEEMAEAVQVYLDVVQADRMGLPLSKLEVEKRFHLDWLHDALYGTCDACLGQPFGKLIVYDYKHGQGVLVSPENNPQAMYYALGALHGETYEQVEIVIVQPRAQAAHPVKRWATTPDALMEWATTTLYPAAQKALAPNAPLAAGDHCRWCPALHVCPEVRKTAFQSAAVAFDAGALPIQTPAEIMLPDPARLSPQELAKVYGVASLLETWLEAVRAEVFRLAEAGADCGYKIVEGRKSRKWKDEQEVIAKLKDRVALFSQKIKTPKGVEDALKKAGLGLDLLSGLVEETRSKCLVPADDPRQSLPPPAVTAFTPVEKES